MKRVGKKMIDVIISDDLIERLTPSNSQVVHAHWIVLNSNPRQSRYELVCSNCKKRVFTRFRYEYCPHCGAKMDKE